MAHADTLKLHSAKKLLLLPRQPLKKNVDDFKRGSEHWRMTPTEVIWFLLSRLVRVMKFYERKPSDSFVLCLQKGTQNNSANFLHGPLFAHRQRRTRHSGISTDALYSQHESREKDFQCSRMLDMSSLSSVTSRPA